MSCMLVSRSNLEYMALSMWTMSMGSQAAQMFVKVTTSLNKMVHASKSPGKRRTALTEECPGAQRRTAGLTKRTDLLPRSCHLWADWLCGAAAWHTKESLSSFFQPLGAWTGFSIPPTHTHTHTHTKLDFPRSMKRLKRRFTNLRLKVQKGI